MTRRPRRSGRPSGRSWPRSRAKAGGYHGLPALTASGPRLSLLAFLLPGTVRVLAGQVLVLLVVIFVFGEILELESAELVEAFRGVGLAIGVRRGGPGERVPGLLGTSGGEQRVSV